MFFINIGKPNTHILLQACPAALSSPQLLEMTVKWKHNHFSVIAGFFLGFNLKKRAMAARLAYVAKTQFLLPVIVYELKYLAIPVNWC